MTLSEESRKRLASARQGKWPKQINFPLPQFRAIKFGALLTSTNVYLCGLRTNVTCLSRGPTKNLHMLKFSTLINY